MTYDELVAELQDWTENDGEEYLRALPRIIRNAEDKIYREVDLLATKKMSERVVPAGSNSVLYPDDAYVVRSIRWFEDNTLKSNHLTMYPYTVFEEYAGGGAATGTPRMWANYGSNTIVIAPAAPVNGKLSINYTYRPAPLSSGNQTSWLSEYASGVLLYGCLVQSGVFNKQSSESNREGYKKFYADQYMEELATLMREEASKGNDTYRMGGTF